MEDTRITHSVLINQKYAQEMYQDYCFEKPFFRSISKIIGWFVGWSDTFKLDAFMYVVRPSVVTPYAAINFKPAFNYINIIYIDS